MKWFLFVILLFLPFVVRADEPRFRSSFTSANGEFELKTVRVDGESRFENWQLINKSSNKELYRLKGDIGSMTVLISDNGFSVVAVDDYSPQDYEKNPEVLIFYNNGEKIKSYKLTEMLDNPKFISVSVSHFQWLFVYEPTFSIKDSKLNLTTYEMNNFVFDIENGETLKKEKNAILSGNAVYVFGKVRGIAGENHEIEVQCAIYGSAKKGDKILFESKERRWEGSGFSEALIIKDGKLIASKGVFYNGCN